MMPNRRVIPLLTFSVIATVTAVLLVAFFALTHGAAHHDLSAVEAYNLWVIRDVETLEPAAAGDFARAILTNLREAFARARTAPVSLPYLLILDGWTLPTGQSIFSARVLSALIALVAIAVGYRMFATRGLALPALIGTALIFTSPLVSDGLRAISTLGFWLLVVTLGAYMLSRRLPHYRRRFRLGRVQFALIVLIMALQLFVLRSTSQDWRTTIERLNQMRAPTEPAITVFDSHSAAAYYDWQHGLKRGLALDLSWQTPDSLTMLGYIAKLTRTSQPVWVMMPAASYGETGWNIVYALTAVGRAPDVCMLVGDDSTVENRMIFARYVVDVSRPMGQNCEITVR